MKPKRVLVVGGGSAGWVAAAYLNAALNGFGERRVQVSLVESPEVPRIAVGEATIPNIKHILTVIGIDELEFMRAVDGTFKQSIRYVNWLENKGESYHHPFTRFRVTPLDRSGEQWLRSDRSIPFMETVSVQPVLCQLGLGPKTLGKWDLGAPLTYAFHMNALGFADFLTEFAKARGVEHYRDHVVDAEVLENGHIAAALLRDGRRIEADLFVDCTGFAALLIEKKLGVPFVDFSKWLLCDRAVTIQIPYEHYYPGRVRPFTNATALSAGWVWDLPLQNRRAIGYVHSSAFLEEDAAERELRAYEGPHCEQLQSRVVNFRVGRREHVWVGNCIAIGLAGGFIEPLESTGLYLSDLASVMLAEHFPYNDDYEVMAFRVNRILANRFYEVLDFINMHYCLTRRTDTEFWREAQKPEHITDRLRAKFDYWKLKPPSPSDFEDQFLPGQPSAALASGGVAGDHRPPIDTAGLWNHESYEAILYGMDFMAEEYRARYGANRPRPRVLKTVIDTLSKAPSRLPPHEVWLKRVLGMADYPTRR